MHRAAAAACIEPVVSYLLFPKRWNNFLKHSLGANRHSPWDWSRWHHVGERKHDGGHCYSALHKDRKGLGVHNRTRNFSPPHHHWSLLICPVHREHPLMFCFHVSALLHGYKKRILQIDLSSLPLLGTNSYYVSSSGLSSHAHFASI